MCIYCFGKLEEEEEEEEEWGTHEQTVSVLALHGGPSACRPYKLTDYLSAAPKSSPCPSGLSACQTISLCVICQLVSLPITDM